MQRTPLPQPACLPACASTSPCTFPSRVELDVPLRPASAASSSSPCSAGTGGLGSGAGCRSAGSLSPSADRTWCACACVSNERDREIYWNTNIALNIQMPSKLGGIVFFDVVPSKVFSVCSNVSLSPGGGTVRCDPAAFTNSTHLPRKWCVCLV